MVGIDGGEGDSGVAIERLGVDDDRVVVVVRW